MKTKKLLAIPVLLLALMAFAAFTVVPQAHAATALSHVATGGGCNTSNDGRVKASGSHGEPS